MTTAGVPPDGVNVDVRQSTHQSVHQPIEEFCGTLSAYSYLES